MSSLRPWLVSSACPLAAFGSYLGFKHAQRRKVFKALRMARIMPEELMRIDLRNALEREEGWNPGSVFLAEIALHKGADVGLYCSCPDEFPSVRALEGGFPDWRELGDPVETKSKQ